MTDVLALVRTRLLALSAVSALVATRVYSGLLPQNAPKPAVALQLIAPEESSQLRGSGGLLETTVQVHSVAATRASALQLADAIAGDGDGAALSHFRGFISGVFVHGILPTPIEREDYRGGDLNEYEVMRSYRVMVAR